MSGLASRSPRLLVLRVVVCACALSPGLAAAQGSASLPAPLDSETIRQYQDRLIARRSAQRAAVQGVVDAAVAATPGAVAKKTTSVTTPDGFPDRVNDALADFLPLFQGAINAVSTSDDKKSVTFKMNPFHTRDFGDMGTSVTLTEPTLFGALVDNIVPGAREDVRKRLLGHAGDLSDRTVSLTYGYKRRAGTWGNPKLHGLWGRDPETYQDLIDGIAESAMGRLDSLDDESVEATRHLAALVRRLARAAGTDEVDTLSFAKARTVLGGAAFDSLVSALQTDVARYSRLVAQVTGWNLSELSTLIDNQPQLTFTGSYHSREPVVGQDSYTVGVNYEWSWRNFNAVISEYRWLKDNKPSEATPANAFARVIKDKSPRSEGKLVFGLTYTEHLTYEQDFFYDEAVTDPATSGTVTVSHRATLLLPRTHEISGKLQWGRIVGGTRSDSLNSRLDVSAEYARNNDPIKHENRLVVRGTLSVPLSTDLTAPITMIYANKPEFLADEGKRFGAYFSLSYKLGSSGGGGK